jgi:hypothetical protein
MTSPPTGLSAELADATQEYRLTSNGAAFRARVAELARDAMPDALVVAAEPYRSDPEIAAVLYERIVEAQPSNARALVILANAFWVTGRGPDIVGELATRALSADPTNRGAWHLWALSEANPRQRLTRWQQVARRFPDDRLALANVGDNAASLAGAEHDHDALDLAIATYEQLLAVAEDELQKRALENALTSLKSWKL